jgi:hypothetical protein
MPTDAFRDVVGDLMAAMAYAADDRGRASRHQRGARLCSRRGRSNSDHPAWPAESCPVAALERMLAEAGPEVAV